jgi:hypothetical protein
LDFAFVLIHENQAAGAVSGLERITLATQALGS